MEKFKTPQMKEVAVALTRLDQVVVDASAMAVDEEVRRSPMSLRKRPRSTDVSRSNSESEVSDSPSQGRARKGARTSKDAVSSLESSRSMSLDTLGGHPEDLTAAELGDRLKKAVAIIRSTSKASKNLKGTSQKCINEASAFLGDGIEVLLRRSISEETKKLRAENTRLSTKLEDLQAQLELMRLEIRCREPLESRKNEESEVSLLRKEIASLAARFGVMEGRILRPPLASDRRGAAPVSYAAVADARPSSGRAAPVPSPSTSASVPPVSLAQNHPIPARKGKSRNKVVASPPVPQTDLAPKEGQWEVVGSRAAAKRLKKKKAKKAKRKAAQLRAPRSAAVILKLQPAAVEGGVTYAELLRSAKEQINLEELGLTEGLRFRATQTGAKMLEVPGATSGPKADALAEKLRAIFPDDKVVVSRPTKSAEVRISGLDDSITAEEVVAVVARVGDCSPSLVKATAIRHGPAGNGTVTVSCPVTAAQKLASGRRLLIGWVAAQVKLLEPRVARCYRCMLTGHVGVQCTSQADCSTRCFRCSRPGHKSGTCEFAPHCFICAAAGKPADHRVGSRACAPPNSKNGGGPEKGAKERAKQPAEKQSEARSEAAMDTQ